jgi:5'-nucleotidase
VTQLRATRRLALAAPFLVAFGVGGDLTFTRSDSPPQGGLAHVRLLGVNDLHGHLEPPRGASGRVSPLGGAANLAGHMDHAAAERPGHTIRVHAGDMVGASPLVSARFHDEPTVRAVNRMGFDVGTVGNHEFDEGAVEALRLVRGGRGFEGASFPYISANVLYHGYPPLPPWRVVERPGVKVGFIGVTTTTAPTYLLGRHRAGLRFLDISETVNRYVPELRRRGVRAIVVLAHSGASTPGDPGRPSGEIVDETRQMSSDVDVVIAGHTHNEINARVPSSDGGGDKLIVEAKSFGTAYDQVDLSISRRSGEVVSKRALIRATPRGAVSPNRAVAAVVRRYARLVARLAHRIVGRAARPLPRAALGTLAARAQRRAAGADVSLVNPGNLRQDLAAGPISYEELFEVHPYEHDILRLRMGGLELRSLLREAHVPLHVSGPRNGELDPSRTYIVAVNELLATSDSSPALQRHARGAHRMGTDLEALERLVQSAKAPLG